MELEHSHIKDFIGNISNKASNSKMLPDLFGRRIGYSSPKYPGFYHVHHIEGYTVKYMDEESCKEFNTTLEQIIALGPAFQEMVTHPEDLPRVKNLLHKLHRSGDEKEVLTYFQRIKLRAEVIEGYTLVITSVRLNLQEQTFVCITNTTDQLPVFSKKICNALNARHETKNMVQLYLKLTTREREIFESLSQGKSVKEIAAKLTRSERTIEQHKKNIYKKLEVNSLAQVIHIAKTLRLHGKKMPN